PAPRLSVACRRRTPPRLPCPPLPTRRSSDLTAPPGRGIDDGSVALSLGAVLLAPVGFGQVEPVAVDDDAVPLNVARGRYGPIHQDRKSTRLNSSHVKISYAVFCLNKKTLTHT